MQADMKLYYVLLCLSYVPPVVPLAPGVGHRDVKKPYQPQPLSQDTVQLIQIVERMIRSNRETYQNQNKFDTFAFDLIEELNTVEKDNIVFSPIGLNVVLAMLFEGARSFTLQELEAALNLYSSSLANRDILRKRFSTILEESLQAHEGKFRIGTRIFVDKVAHPKSDYQFNLKNYYASDIVKVDFSNPSEATKLINNWAKNVTEGHIQDLISESDVETGTIMLLLNAVYFKSQWKIAFPKNQTKVDIFYLDKRKVAISPFMNVLDNFKYINLPAISAHMVELPFKGDNLSMFVLLPYDKEALDGIIRVLSSERSLRSIINSMVLTSVNLTMPKFEYDYNIKLRPTLEKMGIRTMFSRNADLSGIYGGNLVVSNVLQKTSISVTEGYAAATEPGSTFGEIIDFKVDRPFLFFIEDPISGTNVLIGKITNPNKLKGSSTPQEASTDDNIGDANQSDMCELPEQPRHGIYVSAQCRADKKNKYCHKSPGSHIPQFWILEYTCKFNYYLNNTGTSYSVCDKGSWQNPLDCIKYCPPLKSQNVNVQCSFRGKHVRCDLPMKPDTIAKPQCKGSFRPAYVPKYSQLQCLQTGGWDFPLFHCISDIKDAWCVLPQPLQNGQFKPGRRCVSQIGVPACDMIPETPVPPQWPLFYDCNPGYRPNTTKDVSVCLSGDWKPRLPSCVTEVGS